MLQNDIGKENDNDGFIIPMTPITPGACSSPTSPVSPRRTRPRGMSTNILAPSQGSERFISYLRFYSQYWNHFPQSVKRGLGACMTRTTCNVNNQRLDPALVFGEILGVIKGSERAIGTQHRCLDRDTYLSGDGQGISRQGMFSYTKEAVYELFTAYTKLKRRNQEYDAADRSAPPRCSLENKSLSPATGHIIY